jgi:hypothetical protein
MHESSTCTAQNNFINNNNKQQQQHKTMRCEYKACYKNKNDETTNILQHLLLKMHIPDHDCSLFPEFDENNYSLSTETINIDEKQRKENVFIVDVNNNDDEDSQKSTNVSDTLSQNLTSDKSSQLNIFNAIKTTSNKTHLHDYDILLDNQGSTSIFCNKSLLSNLSALPYKLTVFGVGGSINVTIFGYFLNLSTKINYSSNATANILSFSKLRKILEPDKIGYLQKENTFYMIVSTFQLLFRERSGLYICNIYDSFNVTKNKITLFY